MPRPKNADEVETEPLSVRLPRDLTAQLKQRAEDEDRTIANTVRRAVKQYLATTAV